MLATEPNSPPFTIELQQTRDVAAVQSVVIRRCIAINMGMLRRTRLTTAASELARNAVTYGGGGTVIVSSVHLGQRAGIRIEFLDCGPGITNLDLALTDGYTSGRGLGLGLGGAKRLVDEFAIQSDSKGTKVVVTQWC